MDETIGVKGGHNDFRRMFTITKKQKEKLKKYQKEKESKELEKEVKKKQTYTLIKVIPLIIAGQTIKELSNNKKEEVKEESIVIDDNNKEETRQVVIVLKDGTKQIINVPKNIEVKDEIKVSEPIKVEEEKQEIKKEEKIELLEQEEIKVQESVKEEKQDFIPIPIIEEKQINNKETSTINFEKLTDKQRNKLQKLEARKIIDVYERQLKDIRYDLRNLIIDYNTLVDEEDKTIKAQEEEKILDRLNAIIKKIEELKEKIKIEDLDKYDDNYIYTLIEEYLSDFKDKKVIKEIKDSPLYILISEKLDEFDKKKEKFKDKVEDKKDKLEDKEEAFEKLRDKYFKIDKINKELEEFYKEQEQLLQEMREKIDKSVTETEKVEVQIETMNKSTKKLLRRLSLLMFIPGPKGAKAFAAMTGIYSNMAKGIIKPETTTKKYKVVTVLDYSKDIEKNIDKINDVTTSLSNTSKDLDKMISKIKEEYSEYIGVVKECDELLSNLEEVKNNLREKEYELERIKVKQEIELERNNAKVLTRGTYSM